MPKVDVKFKIIGKQIAVDHGYNLFAAISRRLPQLHDYSDVGIHPIAGHLLGNRLLQITEHSYLTVRLPVESISEIIPLAGKTLHIGEYEVQVGVPNTSALIPSKHLYSRLVVIKGFMDPNDFLDAVRRQMNELNIKGQPSLIEQPIIQHVNKGNVAGTRSPYLRRTICIKNKEIVGFALKVRNLTDDDSILLQEYGLGGRRRFGCGVFVPVRG